MILDAALALGGAGYLALAGYVWLHRAAAGGRGLVAFGLAAFIWSCGYAAELSTHAVADARWWSWLKFVGVVTVAPALWSFVVEYTGRARGLSRRTLALLAIEPIAVLVLLALPATRNLIHSYRAADLAADRLDAAPVPDAGALFWPHAIYTYVLLVSALGLFAVRLARISRPYRSQAAVIIAVSLLPLVGNVLYNLGAFGASGPDPTPFLFALFALVLVWGFFRLRLLDLVPVASRLVVEQMVDGVLVLDAYGRIVDANPAGCELLGRRAPEVVGRGIADLMPAAGELLGRHHREQTTRADVALPASDERPARDLALSLQSLSDGAGQETGRLLLLRDVTERSATERRLRDLLDEQTRLADVLQTSLLPALLPQVRGLCLAARSVPAGQGGQLSGDFYDVHQATGGDWAFVLGDVSGKGVRAAVVTSKARYTARTLSARGSRPAELLHQLNQALSEDEDDERFCTVVYGRISGLDDHRPEVAVTVALGGHPAPLIRRRDGSVEPVGVPGTALGLVPKIQVNEVRVALVPGDLLLAYTDGVTEARRNGEFFGEDRLAAVLAGAAGGLGEDAALVVDTVADRVMGAVTEFASDRDDVALLVLAPQQPCISPAVAPQ